MMSSVVTAELYTACRTPKKMMFENATEESDGYHWADKSYKAECKKNDGISTDSETFCSTLFSFNIFTCLPFPYSVAGSGLPTNFTLKRDDAPIEAVARPGPVAAAA